MYYGYLYKTTNLLNGKVYIGKRSSKRFDFAYFGSGINLKRAIKRYGKIHFMVEPIIYAFNNEELNRLEKYYIAEARQLLGRRNVYNISPGGDGFGSGADHPDFNGCKNPFFGRKHTDATKDSLSRTLSEYGHPILAETRARISATLMGHRHSQQTLKRLSESHKGYKCSDETKLKMRLSHLGKKYRTKNSGVTI